MSNTKPKNFALIGASGYIAPKHLKAIADTGNQLVAALDPNDSVGVLDRFFPETKFFKEFERFDRHLEKLRRTHDPDQCVHYTTICSPNYLHDAHACLGLRIHSHVICEKPVVINPWNIEALQELESEYDRKVYTVLQLRHLPQLIDLRTKLLAQKNRQKVDINLSYITRRGPWYGISWKGDESKSGGVAMNIGIHFFDFLLWTFGQAERCELHLQTPTRMAGFVELEWARVRWFLSVDKEDLPAGYLAAGKPAYRSMTMDGQEMEFSEGFTDLHTKVYQEILAGKGFGLTEAKPAIELVHKVRHSEILPNSANRHPILTK